MRWFLMIFAIYITTLAVVPCSDLNNHCEEETNLVDNTEHNHGQDSDDTCTPFCCCTCCGIQMTIVEYRLTPVEVESIQEYATEKVKVKTTSFPSHYFGEIWQPPQINA